MTTQKSNFGRPVSIVGTGSYVPPNVVTNEDMEKLVDTTNEWIITRTGIRERHFAGPQEPTSHLGAEAAKRALADAGLKAEDLDMIVVATITPDMGFPNTACFVQNLIGAKKAFCFDIEAACSGFLYALELGHRMVGSGAIETAMIIGAEKLSSILDWQDRSTCVLFGDAAGAVILQHKSSQNGILSSVLGADGSLAELLMLPGGGSRHPATEKTVKDRMHYLKMAGKEVFKHAVTKMVKAARDALQKSGLTIDQIDHVIPHQANLRIIDAIHERLDVPREKFIINLDRYGNTSAASVVLALDEAVKQGRIKKRDKVLMIAFGGGFTWGASVVEWYK